MYMERKDLRFQLFGCMCCMPVTSDYNLTCSNIFAASYFFFVSFTFSNYLIFRLTCFLCFFIWVSLRIFSLPFSFVCVRRDVTSVNEGNKRN